MASVLITDDEPNIRRMVGALLHAEGYEVREAADGASALRAIAEDEPDAVVLDLMMPGELDGLATLGRIRERWADVPVVMMSGRASLADAVRATKLGAVTFLEKPLAPESVLLALATAVELRQTRREARALREELGLTGRMVGSGAAMARVRDIIERVAPTESRVLVSGESGTGKELVAAAIHERSPRRDRPFVRVNCAAIPRDLVESEMFGHEKGSFTGATERRIGRFELAHTGTIFLDEVGDLGIEAQAKLLRAIEAKEIQRVGGNRTIRVDVRIIAATNRDLAAEVAEGRFREDLYFRLDVIPIAIPPLRDRGDDLVELIEHFTALQHSRAARPRLHWAPDALAAIRAYRWPGNVRELANIVERLAILSDGSAVRGDDVRAVLPGGTPARVPTATAESVTMARASGQGLNETLDSVERSLITEALRAAGGNVAEAARRLATDRANLYRRMRRLGIAGTLALLAAVLVPAPRPLRTQEPVRSDTITGRDTLAPRDTVFDSDTLGVSMGEIQAPMSVTPSLNTGKTYNRVEGLAILFGPALSVERREFSLDAAAYAIARTGRGWRLAAPDGGYDAHVSLTLGGERRVELAARAYDVIVPTERWQMTEPEQGLAAFLLRRDFLDYYGAHGASLSAAWIATRKVTLLATVARERWASRDARNPFTLFRQNGAWRANPQFDEGVVTRADAGAVLDTRNDPGDPSSGWLVRAEFETGHSPSLRTPSGLTVSPGGFLPPGGTRNVFYGRAFVDARRYNRISPRTQLDIRGVYAGWVSGDPLPLQRRVSLGGPGTLPGYDFRKQPPHGPDVLQCQAAGVRPSNFPALCDRVVLGQIELRTELATHPFDFMNLPTFRIRSAGFTSQPVGVVFADAGRGWLTSAVTRGGFKADVGAGVDLGLVAVYVAKAVTDWSEPANVFVRVRRRF